jgi:PKD repeat protein
MKALLRPLLVGGLSIAIAATTLMGSSSVAFAGIRPTITGWPVTDLAVLEGDTPTIEVTFKDPDGPGFYAYAIDWGDGESSSGTIPEAETVWGPWTFYLTKSTPYAVGEFGLVLSVNDGGPANLRFRNVVVSPNTAPSVISLDVTAGTEGGTSSFALTFADPDALDTHTVSVVWGDGATTAPVNVPAGETTFDAVHVYADTGPYALVLTLTDSAGHSVTANAPVPPTNVAPVLGALSLEPSSVVDHQMVKVSGSFTDPGINDTFTLTVDWGDPNDAKTWTESLDNDGSFAATHAYAAEGSVTITATVTDRDNGKSNSSSVDLIVLRSNHAPADLVVQATAVGEGGSTTLSVSFTDADPLDTHTAAITWGDGIKEKVSVTAGSNPTNVSHTYLETGTHTVAVTVTDGGGLSVADSTTATVTNVAPSVTSLVLTPSSVTDHQTVTVSGTITDPGTADSFTFTINWGDGSSPTEPLKVDARRFDASHEYATAGPYDVTATVTDGDGGAGTQTTSVVVTARNTAPSGLALSSNVTGLTATVSGDFTDPDGSDTHDVSMAWGDGTPTELWTLGPGVTLLSKTHTYTKAGPFTVTVTVTDPAGASTNATKPLVTTILSSSPTDVLDQMSALVLSFDLDRNTERWLLRKIDDLRAALTSGGNTLLCADLKTLGHISAFASRVLTSDQAGALDTLSTKLEAAAGCSSTAGQTPRGLKASTVTTTTATPAPAPKKDTTPKTTKTSTAGRSTAK